MGCSSFFTAAERLLFMIYPQETKRGMIMKSLLSAALLCLSVAAFADPVADKTVRMTTEDAEMNAAIQTAQASLDSFLILSAKPPNGTSGFKLKVKVTDRHGTEVMWVTPFQQTATGFSGTLADTPERVTSVRNGQQFTFTRSQIADWGYTLRGKQRGSFTVCVLFKHMPAAEVQKYRDDYGFEC
jgi:uncharacterized protein YegJ (DUF2314 family)